MLVVAWLAMRPPRALSALLMSCKQKTLTTGIGSKGAWNKPIALLPCLVVLVVLPSARRLALDFFRHS